MRIIQFINNLSSGGAERFVVDLSNQLSSMGHNVLIVVYDDSTNQRSFYKSEIRNSVEFQSLKLRGNLNLKKLQQGIFTFRKIVKLFKPDIIHGHLGVEMFMYLSTLGMSKIDKIYTIHSIPPHLAPTRFSKILKNYFYSKKIIRPVTISEECHDSYKEFHKLSNDILIENGRSTLKPSCQFEIIKNEINSIKDNTDEKIFINIARCNEVKNHDMMIDAFNELSEEGYKIKLIIIGSGYFDTDLGNKLRAKALKNIFFLGEKKNISDYMIASDYFTLSSTVEGLPISLLEAISIGKTTVCTPAGGIPNVIKDGINGYVSVNFTKEEYKNSLKRALSHKLSEETIINAYKDRFSMEICAKKYLQIYQSKI